MITLSKVYRPDLTDYAELIEAMTKEINENAMFPMSNTDIVKMCVERGFQSLFPDKKHIINRKRLVEWPF